MYLAHIPVNHHLRPLYRTLAILAALYLAGFGGYGLIESSGLDAFAQDGLPEVLGQQVNPAQAIFDIVIGGLVVVAGLMGRNIDHYVNFWLGHVLLVVGLAMLTLLRTDANILGYNMTNVIVIFVVGLLVLAGSLYGKVGPERPADAERQDARASAGATSGG